VRIELAVIFVQFDALDRLTKIDPAVSVADRWFARVRQPQRGVAKNRRGTPEQMAK
jgi:hypothetical protein